MKTKNTKQISLITIACMLLLLLAFPSTSVLASERNKSIVTVTGQITQIRGMNVTLNRSDTFYPAIEIKVPDWAVTGAEASLSYYNRDSRNYYYEIVKPGERFPLKEAIERERKELN